MKKKIQVRQNPICLPKNTKFFQKLIFFFRKIGPSGGRAPPPGYTLALIPFTRTMPTAEGGEFINENNPTPSPYPLLRPMRRPR